MICSASHRSKTLSCVAVLTMTLGSFSSFQSAAFAFQVEAEKAAIDSEVIEEMIADTEVEKVPMLVHEDSIADLEFMTSGDAPSSLEQLKAMQEHVAELYEKVEPAVVNINNGRGQGSGVVISEDGYILTAAHVISIPNLVAEITFPDGTKAKARTLGLARGVDAGLLKIYRMMDAKKDQPDDSEAEEKDEDKEKDEDEDEGEGESGSGSSSDDDEKEMLNDEQSEGEGEDSEQDGDQKDESDDSDSDESDSDDSDSDESDSESSDEDEPSDSDEEKPQDSEESKDDSSEDKNENDKNAEDKEPVKKKKRSRTERLNKMFAVQEDLPSFKYLDIGDSENLNLGQWIIAIGHPGGLDKKRGLVLRVGRINRKSEDVLRTDCTLVGGDSGGPLIDMQGSVVGIHSRIGGSLRDNFHVPSNQFLTQWKDLVKPIIVDKEPYLGMKFRGRSNVIESFARISPARQAGLKKSDRVIRIGDKEIYDLWQFNEAVQALKPYEEVEFEVQRKGEKETIYVVIGETPTRGRR